MDSFIDNILANLTSVNLEGPAAFVVALLALFAFLRKYSLVLLVILTFVLAWGAEDIILLSINTDDEVISMPLLIYIVGGAVVFLVAIFSFFKSD
jgi:hypothetical protein